MARYTGRHADFLNGMTRPMDPESIRTGIETTLRENPPSTHATTATAITAGDLEEFNSALKKRQDTLAPGFSSGSFANSLKTDDDLRAAGRALAQFAQQNSDAIEFLKVKIWNDAKEKLKTEHGGREPTASELTTTFKRDLGLAAEAAAINNPALANKLRYTVLTMADDVLKKRQEVAEVMDAQRQAKIAEFTSLEERFDKSIAKLQPTPTAAAEIAALTTAKQHVTNGKDDIPANPAIEIADQTQLAFDKGKTILDAHDLREHLDSEITRLKTISDTIQADLAVARAALAATTSPSEQNTLRMKATALEKAHAELVAERPAKTAALEALKAKIPTPDQITASSDANGLKTQSKKIEEIASDATAIRKTEALKNRVSPTIEPVDTTALKEVCNKYKDTPRGKVAQDLLTATEELNNAQEKLNQISSKIVTPAAREAYREEYTAALKDVDKKAAQVARTMHDHHIPGENTPISANDVLSGMTNTLRAIQAPITDAITEANRDKNISQGMLESMFQAENKLSELTKLTTQLSERDAAIKQQMQAAGEHVTDDKNRRPVPVLGTDPTKIKKLNPNESQSFGITYDEVDPYTKKKTTKTVTGADGKPITLSADEARLAVLKYNKDHAGELGFKPASIRVSDDGRWTVSCGFGRKDAREEMLGVMKGIHNDRAAKASAAVTHGSVTPAAATPAAATTPASTTAPIVPATASGAPSTAFGPMTEEDQKKADRKKAEEEAAAKKAAEEAKHSPTPPGFSR